MGSIGQIPWNKGKNGLQKGWNKGTKGVMKPNQTSFKKGHIPWSKGKKGEYSLKHNGQFKKGFIPWNKNKKGIYSKNTIEKMRQARIGKPSWSKGKHPECYQGSNNPAWNGGKRICNGYILIHQPNHPFRDSGNYVSEHRVVVEKHIGRYLTRKEVVHHLGEINDNRLHKLMAFSSNSAHMRFHKNPLNVKPEEIIFDGRKII